MTRGAVRAVSWALQTDGWDSETETSDRQTIKRQELATFLDIDELISGFSVGSFGRNESVSHDRARRSWVVGHSQNVFAPRAQTSRAASQLSSLAVQGLHRDRHDVTARDRKGEPNIPMHSARSNGSQTHPPPILAACRRVLQVSWPRPRPPLPGPAILAACRRVLQVSWPRSHLRK